jgi:hypothetical protein
MGVQSVDRPCDNAVGQLVARRFAQQQVMLAYLQNGRAWLPAEVAAYSASPAHC